MNRGNLRLAALVLAPFMLLADLIAAWMRHYFDGPGTRGAVGFAVVMTLAVAGLAFTGRRSRS